MGYADSHLHLTDPCFKEDISGAELLFGCTARPSEWQDLQGSNDGRVIRFFGTHPWYCRESDIDMLKDVLEHDDRAQIGEIGMDMMHPDPDIQVKTFQEQLDLAKRYDRIVNVHMIRCEEEMLKILRRNKVICILHSFSGPVSYIRPFTECGCYFSVSPRILRRSEEKVRSLISAIPEDRLLIETDAPNNDISMDEHIQCLSSIMSVSADDLIRTTLHNARSIAP